MSYNPLTDREAEEELARGRSTADLAARLSEDAIAPYRAAAALLAGPPQDLATFSAKVFLNVASEPAVQALLDAPPVSEPLRPWLLRALAAGGVAGTRRLVRWLQPILEDVRPAPDAFARRPGSRLCDEAFLMLREVIAFDEPELGEGFDEPAFFAWPTRRRDAFIRMAQSTPSFRRVTEGV